MNFFTFCFARVMGKYHFVLVILRIVRLCNGVLATSFVFRLHSLFPLDNDILGTK